MEKQTVTPERFTDFKAELKALLEKYNAEIKCEEGWPMTHMFVRMRSTAFDLCNGSVIKPSDL